MISLSRGPRSVINDTKIIGCAALSSPKSEEMVEILCFFVFSPFRAFSPDLPEEVEPRLQNRIPKRTKV